MKSFGYFTKILGVGAVLALAPLISVSAAQEEGLQPLETREVAGPADEGGISLQAIERYLNTIRTLKADFVQVGDNGQVARGQVFLERPGKVRFEYEGEVPILIVSDGTILNFIDYEVNQVTRWPVKDTPLSLLLEDEITFGEDVEITGTGPGPLANMTAVTAHDPEKPEQGMLTLLFSKTGNDGLRLDAWKVVDAQGAETTISLSGYQVNMALKDGLWEFDDPRGERFKRRRQR